MPNNFYALNVFFFSFFFKKKKIKLRTSSFRTCCSHACGHLPTAIGRRDCRRRRYVPRVWRALERRALAAHRSSAAHAQGRAPTQAERAPPQHAAAARRSCFAAHSPQVDDTLSIDCVPSLCRARPISEQQQSIDRSKIKFALRFVLQSVPFCWQATNSLSIIRWGGRRNQRWQWKMSEMCTNI